MEENKMNIVVSGLFYPVTMMQYFINALERRDDVNLWTCGPFNGTWIPWGGGMHIDEKYVYTPSLCLDKNVRTRAPYGRVANDVPFEPDLWLQIDAGWHFMDRPKAKIVAHIQTDPHVLKHTYSWPKSYSDFSFCMQTPYIQAGEWYLPYGYDPKIHYPEDLEKEYDVCLIGLQYEARTKLISALERKGFSVYYTIGKVYDDYRNLYNKSRIALSWSSLLDLPARVWEAFGMALPLVTNRLPDLSTFFVEEDHYLGFDSLGEAVQQVEWLLQNPEDAEIMAQAGYRKGLPHTWDSRIDQVLEIVKLQ